MSNKKRTIAATTEFGTFTRKTHRNYSHVVIVCGLRPDELTRRLNNEISYLEESLTYLKKVHSGEEPNQLSKWRTGEQLAAEIVEKQQLLIKARETRDEKIAANLAKIAAGVEFSAENWCGRFDLANKAAAKARETYAIVKIVAVDPEPAAAEPGPVWAAEQTETFTNAAGVGYSNPIDAKDFEADDLAEAEDRAAGVFGYVDAEHSADVSAAIVEALEDIPGTEAHKYAAEEKRRPARPDRDVILNFYHAGDLLGLAFDAALRGEPTVTFDDETGRMVDALEVDRTENVRRRLEDMLRAVVASARDMAAVSDLKTAVESLRSATYVVSTVGQTDAALGRFARAALSAFELATRQAKRDAENLMEIDDEFPYFDFPALSSFINDVTGNPHPDTGAAAARFCRAEPFTRPAGPRCERCRRELFGGEIPTRVCDVCRND